MIKLYKIRDWNLIFENNRSRELKSMSWVAVPNRHDGENFSSLMVHKNGAVIFAAWVLMVQVASKCDPRGTLLRGSKKPHTPQSLSLITRAPEAWFKMAIDFLEKETDWFVVEELTSIPHDGAEISHPPAVPSVPFLPVLSIPSEGGCKGETEAEKIYAEYPKKVAKGYGLKAIEKCLRDHPFDLLLEKTKAYATARNGNLEFVPHPATWFNGLQFKDDPKTWVPIRNGKPQIEIDYAQF